jgi:hypothetical protein
MFRSRAQTFVMGGPAKPDLFPETFALELLGHHHVYAARKELAQLRLVQSAPGKENEPLRDALRLLRQAGARKELDLAVEHIRAAGPLWALSEDARQVLVQRATPELLREPELRVLRGAAEVMTLEEAARALRVVRDLIASGGPSDSPGSRHHPTERLGSAWLTASALANAAEQPGVVAELLLIEAKAMVESDHLRDQAIGRALRQLDWDNVPPKIVNEWANCATETIHCPQRSKLRR